jgi:hypothetical protein
VVAAASPAAAQPALDGPDDAATMGASAPPPAPVPAARPEPTRVGLGLRGGLGFQPDQAVVGPHVEVRGVGVSWLEADFALMPGVAVEHWMLRASLHVRPVLRFGDVRLYPTVGAGLSVYQPRGGFADFCDKTNLACGGVDAGVEVGVGGGWRSLSLDLLIGLGDLAIYNLLGAVTWVL